MAVSVLQGEGGEVSSGACGRGAILGWSCACMCICARIMSGMRPCEHGITLTLTSSYAGTFEGPCGCNLQRSAHPSLILNSPRKPSAWEAPVAQQRSVRGDRRQQASSTDETGAHRP